MTLDSWEKMAFSWLPNLPLAYGHFLSLMGYDGSVRKALEVSAPNKVSLHPAVPVSAFCQQNSREVDTILAHPPILSP